MKTLHQFIFTALSMLGLSAALPAQTKNETALSLYVPGEYQKWNPANAPVLRKAPGSERKYEGYINIQGTGRQYFKFTSAPDWDHINYGDAGAGALTADGLADGLSVPAGGYYYMTVDLDTSRWSATKIEWGVIGSATPGGWDRDTPMTYYPKENIWKATVKLRSDGSFKFRANRDWQIDFGVDEAGQLKYSNNPFYGYDSLTKDFTVPNHGTYVLTLDLSRPGNYQYAMERAANP